MNCTKKLFAAALMLFGAMLPAVAQLEEDPVTFPQIFFGAQGGAQVTLTDAHNAELLTPTASLSVGSFFTSVIGARLHFNGIWNKGGYEDAAADFKYKYRYLTSDIDLLVNLVTMFGRKKFYPINLYLIGGVGLNYAWHNGEAFAQKDLLPLAYDDGRFSHNARIGAMFDFNISKHVAVNLEFAANTLKDRYNSKYSAKGDWQLTAQLGVAYKFAAKRTKKAVAPVAPAEVWETRTDTIWYDDVVEAPKPTDGTRTWTVFYDIRESDFQAEAQLAEIGTFLKDWQDCSIDIKSYADKGTGNAEKNLQLSRERMEKAVKALTDAGVPASAITANCYGDTIQPFAENDKNRVTIITSTGRKSGGEKRMVKKFRTKEVRYRVR